MNEQCWNSRCAEKKTHCEYLYPFVQVFYVPLKRKKNNALVQYSYLSVVKPRTGQRDTFKKPKYQNRCW